MGLRGASVRCECGPPHLRQEEAVCQCGAVHADESVAVVHDVDGIPQRQRAKGGRGQVDVPAAGDRKQQLGLVEHRPRRWRGSRGEGDRRRRLASPPPSA
jgi:hypothetical protein